MSETHRLSRQEDDRIMGISMMLVLPLLLGGTIYLIILSANGTIDYSHGILYSFLLLYPLSMGLWLALYEILAGRKIHRPLQFRIKRFLYRMTILSSYALMLTGLWSVFNLFLSAFISWKYILLLAGLTSSLTLLILVAVPKTRRIIDRFTNSE